LITRHPPISLKCPHFLHGGDYNPDQWVRTPEVWDEDMRLMKLAGCNTMSIGIFSWTALEPKEGVFNFGWLDTIMDKLAANGAFAVLATPSGAKPIWMSEKYPEVRRMSAKGERDSSGWRHNHCRTSPVYREKCAIINTKLAERYQKHPALLIWHVSNEYNGDACHCPHCIQAFQNWLRARYQDNLDNLNHAWWTGFWSHGYGDWREITAIDSCMHGMMLDWNRFNTDQTIDFYQAECAPLRRHTPQVPVTTNFMGFCNTLDYWKFAQVVDVIAWDSYPSYQDRPHDWVEKAISTSLCHSMNRSFLQKPFMLMESSPSVQNWAPVNKLKRPGLHLVETLQAVGHGSDTVQYFQWRKSRGGCEKFHGAVVDHCATEQARAFQEVAALGKILGRLDDVIGTTTRSEVAILHDWENGWAIDFTCGPRNEKKNYLQTCVEHYRPFWSAGVNVDVVREESDFSGYKLLIAPMMYMVRPGVAERIQSFVRHGGVFVTTYLSGVANESDLCFLNGFPGPLRELLGIWAEEIDAINDDESVPVVAVPGNQAGLAGSYQAGIFCDRMHAEGAEVLATYGAEFYKGQPAVTVNALGQGQAYYIASRNDARFHADFFNHQIEALGLTRALGCTLPDGVTACTRTDGKREFVFVLGFNREACRIDLGGAKFKDVVTGEAVAGQLDLPLYTARVLERLPAKN
jgi:beta-galactosidase